MHETSGKKNVETFALMCLCLLVANVTALASGRASTFPHRYLRSSTGGDTLDTIRAYTNDRHLDLPASLTKVTKPDRQSTPKEMPWYSMLGSSKQKSKRNANQENSMCQYENDGSGARPCGNDLSRDHRLCHAMNHPLCNLSIPRSRTTEVCGIIIECKYQPTGWQNTSLCYALNWAFPRTRFGPQVEDVYAYGAKIQYKVGGVDWHEIRYRNGVNKTTLIDHLTFRVRNATEFLIQVQMGCDGERTPCVS